MGHHSRRVLAAFAIAALTGCSSSGSGTSLQLTAEEKAAFDAAGAATLTVQQSLRVADRIFEPGPDLAADRMPAENARALQTRANASVQGCATVALSGTMLSVDFGPPPGCTLDTGVVVSGKLTASVSKDGGLGAVVELVFTGLAADGVALDGTLRFSTKDGAKLFVALKLTSGSSTLDGSLEVDGKPGGSLIGGEVTRTEADRNATVAFAAVTIARAQCYASGGILAISSGSVTEIAKIDAATASTGIVQVSTKDNSTVEAKLPAYGKCPPPR